jgi:hypothetical protein
LKTLLGTDDAQSRSGREDKRERAKRFVGLKDQSSTDTHNDIIEGYITSNVECIIRKRIPKAVIMDSVQKSIVDFMCGSLISIKQPNGTE